MKLASVVDTWLNLLSLMFLEYHWDLSMVANCNVPLWEWRLRVEQLEIPGFDLRVDGRDNLAILDTDVSVSGLVEGEVRVAGSPINGTESLFSVPSSFPEGG